MNQHYNEGDLSRLGALSGYQVASDDPDPRGWAVRTSDGQRVGEVQDLLVDKTRMKVEFIEVRTSGNAAGPAGVLTLPLDAADLDASAREVIVHDASYLRTGASDVSGTRGPATNIGEYRSDKGDDAARLTRSEEELRIGKREVERGELVVNKSVETEHVSTPVQRRVERVRVERRPVEGATGVEPTITEDEIRVPIVEEEVVVDKRAVVKEEIVVSRDVDTETETVTADLRKERVHVEGEELAREGEPVSKRGRRG